MGHGEQAEVAVAATAAFLIASPTLLYLPQFVRRFGITKKNNQQEPAESLYQDEDGTATLESMSQYSVGAQKLIIVLAASCGLGISTAFGTRMTVLAADPQVTGQGTGDIIAAWLLAFNWLCLNINTIFFYPERHHAYIFGHCRRIFCFALLLLMAQTALLLVNLDTLDSHSLQFGLIAGQLGVSAVIVLTSILTPRRPDVYHNGRKVDGMRTGSLLSRYMFFWADAILKKAVEKGHLDEHDLGALDRQRRAERLQEHFYEISMSPKLYRHVFRAHWKTIVKQWAGTVILTTANFTSPVIMNQILRQLEMRDRGEVITTEAWLWVIGLGAVKFFETIAVGYLYWVSYTGLLIPIRNQLSAVLFTKTLRKKDVKGLQEAGERQDDTNSDKLSKPGEEDKLKNMKQGAINLLSVDAERVALFCVISNSAVESLFGALYGFSFIIVTLGWRSLLVGLCTVVLTTPVNIYFMKKYSRAQDDLMKIRDKKIAAVSEALQGIRQIKFSAMEDKWEQRIKNVRGEELRILRRVFVASLAVISAWIINPVLLSAAALSVYAVIQGSMSPSVAFPALAIFGQLEWTLSVVPELVTDAFDALVSIGRIQHYLESAEKEPVITDSQRIALVNATIAWAANTDEENRFCLRNINLEFPRGELSIITGRTGSGKSLLLSALLGEADLIAGKIEMPLGPSSHERFDLKAVPSNWILPDAVAFVAQIPWIENGSIKDNILFELPYDKHRYRKTLFACALEKDLESLSDGDLTEIGANGINLSGGQRWRVSFARAVYSRAGILILDDIFSAVDAHVGKHIFEYGLTGELMRNRTRILVTHHLKLCISRTSYAATLSNGTVENAGSVTDLQGRGLLDRIFARVEDGERGEEEQTNEEEPTRTITRESTRSRRNSEVVSGAVPTPRQFIQNEERERGAVKWVIYKAYLMASGGVLIWAVLLTLFAMQEGLVIGRQYLVKLWTEDRREIASVRNLSLIQYSLQQLSTVAAENHSVIYWIGIYTAVSLITCFVGSGRYAYIFMTSLRASRVLFDDMLHVVVRAPLRWLDTVPTGRILNRFSKDFETVDSRLTGDIAFFLWSVMGVIGVNFAAVYLSRYALIMAILGLMINVHYAIQFLAGAREIKRLESNSRSPIFDLFGATLTGVATIRAFGHTQEYMDKMFSRIDTFGQRTYYNWLFNRWVSMRMGLIGSVFVALVGILVISMPSINAALAGFALSFAVNYSINVVWTLRRYANMELDMNSTERIVEYTNLPTEEQGGIDPPAAWPTEGRVEVDDLFVSYAPDLAPVLKGITFDVKPRERVGIVGRTGAGKSSLTLALFQFIRASSGSIFIDGLDISKIKLKELRSRLAIIPQDPVLFSGTIRSNLDSFGEHTDTELKEALRRVHLVNSIDASEDHTAAQDANSNVFSNLDSGVSEGGLNLSQGQRQLLCLSRAIISRPKILILDEATSAVDMEMDSLIQTSIREEFTDCTTLVIAHRLQTVADYDKILVLGDGKVLEFDEPWKLMQKKGSFYEMVQQSGEADTLEEAVQKAAERRNLVII